MTDNAANATAAKASGESESARQLRERLLAVTEEARRLSRVLPQAMAFSAQGNGLADALAPALERALAVGGRRSPATLGDALHPVVGRAMRTASWQMLRRGLQHLNHVILKYASITGLRWRLEARRQGRPFAQVFLEHTRQRPVKQVFLIHRETGILLQQAQSELDASQDWDVVSGMLTAIGDFIHDSFSVGKEDQLETIRVGDLTILIEQGRHAALAGMLRGEVPADLRDRMRAALDRVHTQFADELELFDGETSVFDKSRSVLESCLQALVATDQSRILPQTWLVAALPVLALGAWATFSVRDHQRWRAYVSAITADPGIVVIDSGRTRGRYFVHGLREISATDPVKALAEHGYVVAEVDSRWAPFQWTAASLTAARLRELLNPPDSVTISEVEGQLVLGGAARQDWLDAAREKLRPLAGARIRLDDVTISDLGEFRRWDKYIQQLAQEPGVVVLESGRRDGRFHVRGLRDPLARDPATLLGQFGLAAGDITARWEPYQALEPAFTLERVRQAVDPPHEVTLELRDGVLLLTGRASRKWIERADSVARAIPGIRTINKLQLVDIDFEEILAIQNQIEGELFRFLLGAPDLWPGQGARIELLVANTERLARATERHGGYSCAIEIVGHTNPTGNSQRDLNDSQELASSFAEHLKNSGADMSRFTQRGAGTLQPRNADAVAREAHNRLVTFKVKLTEH